MKLSYQNSYFIDSCISGEYKMINGRNMLLCSFLHADKTISKTCFALKGNEFFAAIAHGPGSSSLDEFVQSFALTNYKLPAAKMEQDTFYNYSIRTPYFYDVETISHRNAADKWISRYKGNKEFETKIKNEFSPTYIYLMNDTTGYRLNMSTTYAFSKTVIEQFADSIYLKRVKNDTALISKPDFVMLTDGTKGRFNVRSFTKKTMPDGSIEKTIIIGWPASSRLKYIKTIELPERDQLRKVSFQFDSSDMENPLVPVAESYGVADLAKIPVTDGLGNLLKKAQRADTAINKNFYTDLSKALYRADEKYLPEIIFTVKSLPPAIKDYLRIKERLISSLSYLPTKESSDFLADYFQLQEDTFSIRKACLNALFAQHTAYSLDKGMTFLMEDPDVDYTSGDSPLSAYIRYANNKKDDQASRQAFAVLGDHASQIASLLNETAWKDDAIRTLQLLQEKGLLKEKILKPYLGKLLLFAKKEVRRSRQTDMRRIEAAKNVTDNDDNISVSSNFVADFSGPGEREGSSLLITSIGNLLLPYKKSEPQVAALFDKIWQLDSSNTLKKSFLLFAIRKGMDYPDSVRVKYLNNETKAYSFIREAIRDSVDIGGKYNIAPAAIARFLVLKDNMPGTRNFIDSISLEKTDTVLQKDSIHFIYFYKTFQKKDRKNSAWVVCKITRSAWNNKYIYRDFLKASSGYSITNNKFADKDKEQLYLRILYDEYRPLNRFFNGVKGYTGFNIQYP
jgi:hypothetical protein